MTGYLPTGSPTSPNLGTATLASNHARALQDWRVGPVFLSLRALRAPSLHAFTLACALVHPLSQSDIARLATLAVTPPPTTA